MRFLRIAKDRIIAFLILSIIGAILIAIFKPAITFASSGSWWLLLLWIAIAVAVFAHFEGYDDEIYLFTTLFVIAGVILLFIFVIGGFNSSQVGNRVNYHNLIKIEEGIFEEEVLDIDKNSYIPVIEVNTLENTTNNSVKESSLYETSKEYSIIKFKGRYYKLSENSYKDFYSYNEMKSKGIPGYELYDIETGEITFVGLKDYIKYSPSAYFEHNIKWHLYINYSDMILGESVFEIDEDGVPYYITPTFKATIGWFGGIVQDKIIVTNAVTGEDEFYSVENAPEWIDNVYSKEYLLKMINYNLANADTESGTNMTAYQYKSKNYNYDLGYNYTIMANGQISLYTNVISTDNVKATIGFVLANMHTGVVKYYNIRGADEAYAMEAAEKLMPSQGYTAIFPTIVNVNGEETYFIFLRDSSKTIKKYILCNFADYTKIVEAETIKEALRLYKEKLQMEDTSIKVELDESDAQKGDNFNENSEYFEVEGKIVSIYQAEVDGFTHFYFTLDENDNFYDSIVTNNSKQVMLEVGTKVKVKYIKSSEEGVYIVKEIDF